VESATAAMAPRGIRRAGPRGEAEEVLRWPWACAPYGWMTISTWSARGARAARSPAGAPIGSTGDALHAMDAAPAYFGKMTNVLLTIFQSPATRYKTR
jgi:hypothetical protein